ncbi:MAG: hypothetical protein ACE37I_15980 [Rubinisphaera brasiliensis]|uniref:hypothetical protein n=1 Tax=Rubinisphaera brasiliensis TaxID=119 RepID=UPI00391DA7C4|nr:hypothetical protein [bacterium]
MAKLFVIPARDEPMAVILRRGPSAWYHVIQWDMRRDLFVHGAWFKGRIYEEKCDVSPDGRLFVYFVHQGSRHGTQFTHAWTAISRVPWLKALAVWPQKMTYGGGGRFSDNRSLTVRALDPALEEFPSRGVRLLNEEAPEHGSSDEVPGADWCGRDHQDRVIFTRADRLYRREKRTDTLIADFTDLTPNPQPAPDWAARPL